jgi:hypothetical protein
MIEETFLEAKTYFQTFLSDNNLPTDLIWLFYEDLYWQYKYYFANSKSITENEQLAEKLFELGKRRNFGIEILAFCEFGAQVGCYIFLPEDDTEAMHRMMAKEHIKYGFRTPLEKAEFGTNIFRAKLLNFFASDNTLKFRKDFLPSKKLAVSRLLVNH